MASATIIPNVEGYIIAEKLGAGSYADVYKAFKKGEKRDVVAIKCVNKNKLSKSALNNLVSEIEILKSLCHENIVKLKNFTWDNSHIFIIMEYCSGGNLSTYIHKRQRLNENICQTFLQQLVFALMYLREKNISHFDLKPQNIFLASKKLQILKIGDFGLAQYISDDDKNFLIKGSPLYMAPEIVLKREYDARADIWSVGIILYECLFGNAPYSSKSFEELMNKIKSDKPIEIPYSANISSECRDFLLRCLERELSKRLDFNSFFYHTFVDVKHAPTSNSINEASVHLGKAVELDTLENFSEAFEEYNEALKYLIPVMHIELDAQKRMNLRKKINEYISRMEKLRTGSKSEHLKMVEVPETLQLNPEKICYNGCISELLQLTQTTPQMKTAIEIAQAGELYEQESNFSAALEKYEMALGKLLTLIQNEPKGRRRDLLLEEINRWMNQAERIKSLEKNALDKNALEMQSLDNHQEDRSCCVQ